MSLQALGIVANHFPMSASLAGFCLTLANIHNAETGRCNPSVGWLAKQLECNERTIQRYFAAAEEAGILTRKTRFANGRQTCNMVTFLSPRDGASVTPGGGTSVTQIQEVMKQETDSGSTKRDPSTLPEFLIFWEKYPKKVDKRKAATAFARLSKTKQHAATEDAATRYAGRKKQFIPNPTTYINGERWEDEPLDGSAADPDYAKGAL